MTTAKFYDILYIQSEGKQGHLHSLRSVSPHRYLRYISWISWKAATLYKLGRTPARPAAGGQGAARNFSVAAIQYLRPPLTPQDRSILFCSSLFYNRETNLCVPLLEKEKIIFFPFPVPLSCVAFAAGPSPPARLLPRPSHKQKMRARSCRREPAHHVYQTCSKKRRLPAQEIVRRCVRLTRSQHTFSHVFFEHQRPAFAALFPFSLFTKENNNQTQTQKVQIHRSVLTTFEPHDGRDALRASPDEIYVAIATRFVRDCVEDLAVLTTWVARIPKSCWPTKDQYPGVDKAIRISTGSRIHLQYPPKISTFSKIFLFAILDCIFLTQKFDFYQKTCYTIYTR